MSNRSFNAISATTAAVYTAATVRSTAVNPVQEPRYRQFVATLIGNAAEILLDESVIRSDYKFRNCIDSLRWALQQFSRRLIIAQCVMNDLRYESKSNNPEVSSKAQEALAYIDELNRAGLVSFKGDPNRGDVSARWIFQYVCMHAFDTKLLVLTENEALARDCQQFAGMQFVNRADAITVKRIANGYGKLGSFGWGDDMRTAQRANF